MFFKLLFTKQAASDLSELESSPNLAKRLKTVRKTLGYLEVNPRHPGLHTHKYYSLRGYRNEEIFESYVENNTPSAYRIFWHYGPSENAITIVAIISHP